MPEGVKFVLQAVPAGSLRHDWILSQLLLRGLLGCRHSCNLRWNFLLQGEKLSILLLTGLSPVFQLVTWENLVYQEYHYPWWAHAVGYFMAGSSMLCIPGYAIWLWVTTPGTWREVRQSSALQI